MAAFFQHTYAPARLTVQGFAFIQEFPQHCCYFVSSQEVKPPCTAHCLLHCFSAIALQRSASKNIIVNMLPNRYCIHPQTCMTIGDPTWTFVLPATEIWRLTVQLLMCRPFKSSPYPYAAHGRGEHDHTLASHAHLITRTYAHAHPRRAATADDLMLLKDCFHSCLGCLLVLGAEQVCAFKLSLHLRPTLISANALYVLSTAG